MLGLVFWCSVAIVQLGVGSELRVKAKGNDKCKVRRTSPCLSQGCSELSVADQHGHEYQRESQFPSPTE